MKWLAAAIVVCALVALVIGWRATQHHHACTNNSPFSSCR